MNKRYNLIASACALIIAAQFSACNFLNPITSTQLDSSSSSNVTTGGGGGTTTPPVGAAGVSSANYQTCYAATPTDANALSTCLNASAVNGGTFPAATISSCFTAGNTSSLYLATCLQQAGKIVFSYRSPTQFDIDSCNAAVGETGIASCLGKHGTDLGITQAEIDQCNAAAGEAGIEKCLHKNGFIATNPIVMQSDANFCNLVEGGTSNLALCLQNAGLLPATVTQTEINTCVNAVTATELIRCLRINYIIPNVLMQFHITACNTAVGASAIANCLNNNGVLPIDPSSTDTAAEIVTALQVDINSCVAAVGVASVAQCLRKRGIISNQVMQQHIDSCFAVAGVNAYNCLAANFAVLPTTLTSAALQTCFAKNGNTSANAASCLASAAILPTAPQQVHINECAKFAGIDADTTGTKPGEVGVAACLGNSGMLPAALTQAEVDTCVTAVGLPNVAACLNTKGFVPSYAMMLSPSGVYGTSCVVCHNATTMDSNFNITTYAGIAGKVVAGNSAGSKLYTEVSGGDMPRVVGNSGTKGTMLSAANIADIGLWITQGANDDLDVPAVASAVIPAATGTAMGNLTGGGGLAAAFNGTTSQTAAKSAQALAVGGYIGKTFATPETVTGWAIWGSSDQCYNNPAVNGAMTLQLQYSDDNVTYTTVDSVTTTATCAGPEAISRNLPGPNTAHLYWRVMQAAGGKGNLTVGQLEFIGY